MTEDAAATGPTKVFLISPIGEDKSQEREQADTVRRYLVEKALSGDKKYRVERADDDTNPGNITPRIIASIQDADLIVADLTGLNPNVFYELAVAHGYGKPVVLIFKKGERIPFDLKDVRVVHYDMTHPAEVEKAQMMLRSYAEAALKDPGSIQTPLSAAGRFRAVEESTDPQVDALTELTEQVVSLRRSVSSMLSKSPDPDANPTAADTVALRDLLEGLANRGLVKADALEELPNQSTSAWFDTWVKELAERVRKQPDPWATPSNSKNDPWATPASQSTGTADPWTAGSDEPPF